jgi:hypothetical protein
LSDDPMLAFQDQLRERARLFMQMYEGATHAPLHRADATSPL